MIYQVQEVAGKEFDFRTKFVQLEEPLTLQSNGTDLLIIPW